MEHFKCNPQKAFNKCIAYANSKIHLYVNLEMALGLYRKGT